MKNAKGENENVVLVSRRRPVLISNTVENNSKSPQLSVERGQFVYQLVAAGERVGCLNL